MAATRRTSRDLWLAAVFLWITPCEAALSIRFTARRSSSTLSSAPSSAATMAVFERVRISARTDLLRNRRFSFWRFRLIWLLMLATCDDSSVVLERGWRRDGSPPDRSATVAGGGHDPRGAGNPVRAQCSWPGGRGEGRRRDDRRTVSPAPPLSGPVATQSIRKC